MCGTEEEASSESELAASLLRNLSTVLFICSGDLSLAVFLLPASNGDDVVSILLLVKHPDDIVMASFGDNECSEDDNFSELLALWLKLFPT